MGDGDTTTAGFGLFSHYDTVRVSLNRGEWRASSAEGERFTDPGYYRILTAYVNTRDNCTIKVTGFTPDYPTLEEMPTDEDMIASLEPVFAAIRTAE